ncbi:MAG: hypothetical protein JNK82_09035 [Myxococcaceae bacterium]|nr:hypothetical protein [Myxococcaceae bacterium]
MKRCHPVLVGVSGLLFAAGCLTDNRASRDRGAAGIFENVQVIAAPSVKRCDKFNKGGAARGRCDEAKYLAEVYVKKLSTGDMVCLEGGFGEEPGGGCLARASVADTATGRLLLELKDARPNSRWAAKESNQYWFEEGALIDLYLVENGY